MCYSAESSLTSYLLGSASSLYLLFQNNKYEKFMGLILLVVVQMQLVEYFLWTNNNCNSKINKIATKYIGIVLALQIISLIFGSYFFNISFLSKNNLLIMGAIFAIVLLINKNNILFSGEICSTSKNNTMIWYSNLTTNKDQLKTGLFSFFYFLFGIIIFANIKDPFYRNYISIWALVTIAYSLLFFNNWTSRWCYFGSFGPFFLVILSLFKKIVSK